MTTTRMVSRWLAVLSLIWCMGVGWRIRITPFGGNSLGDVSLFGPLPLVVPAALAGAATWAAWNNRRVWLLVATLLMAVFSFISGFSIGSFYVPAAVVLVFSTLSGSLGPGAGTLIAVVRASRRT